MPCLVKLCCSHSPFPVLSRKGTKRKSAENRMTQNQVFLQFLVQERLMQFAKSPSHDFYICYGCLVFSASQKLSKIIKDCI